MPNATSNISTELQATPSGTTNTALLRKYRSLCCTESFLWWLVNTLTHGKRLEHHHWDTNHNKRRNGEEWYLYRKFSVTCFTGNPGVLMKWRQTNWLFIVIMAELSIKSFIYISWWNLLYFKHWVIGNPKLMLSKFLCTFWSSKQWNGVAVTNVTLHCNQPCGGVVANGCLGMWLPWWWSCSHGGLRWSSPKVFPRPQARYQACTSLIWKIKTNSGLIQWHTVASMAAILRKAFLNTSYWKKCFCTLLRISFMYVPFKGFNWQHFAIGFAITCNWTGDLVMSWHVFSGKLSPKLMMTKTTVP